LVEQRKEKTFQRLRKAFKEEKGIMSKIKNPMLYLRTSEAAFLLLFSIVVGLGAGFGAIIFRWLINNFHNLFFKQGHNLLQFMGQYYVILIPAIGGLIIGPLIYFFAREAKGHGVPEVMLAVATLGGKIRPRVAVIKALASSICIGSGGSVGREGPIVQIGSSLGSTLGQLFKLSEEKTKILVACGAAGGIAATFNAPLAGIFFSLEVILREYGIRFFSSVVLSSVTATVISRHFLGDYPAFMVPPYQLLSVWEIPLYFIFGFLAAFSALLYIKILYKCEDFFNAWKVREYIKPAIGGLLIGSIGFFFPQIFGVGYETIELALFGKIALGLVSLLVFVKILATSLTLGSGGSGGVFAPSLFIGAMLGEAYGKLTYLLVPNFAISSGAAALVGMGAVFAGASHAPISAIIIIFEMSGNYKIILPLMITCIISMAVVRHFTKESIYTLKLRRRGIDIQSLKDLDLMETIKVSEAMIKDVMIIDENTTVSNEILMTHRGFPVLNDKGNLVGMVTRQDINKVLANGETETPIKKVMKSDIVLCYPDENLRIALERLAEKDIGRLPVVERSNHSHLIGLITREAIITTYNQASKKRQIDRL
jgi:CIC family chloride channel protein